MTALAEYEVDEEVIDEQYEAEQAWLAQRLGKITCSKFGELIGTGRSADDEFTQAGYTYLYRVIAERLGSCHDISSRPMQWGTDNEPNAIECYAGLTSLEVDYERFRYFEFTSDIGGTPDALVGTDGCAEVKCPFDPAMHIETLVKKCVPKKYLWQCYGHIVVAKRQWCDFVSFDPRIEGPERIAIVRLDRDEKKLKHLMARLDAGVQFVKQAIAAMDAS